MNELTYLNVSFAETCCFRRSNETKQLHTHRGLIVGNDTLMTTSAFLGLEAMGAVEF